MSLALHHKHKSSVSSNRGVWSKAIDSLAYAGGILIPVMTLPQLWKIIQSHSAASLSLISWASYVVGVSLWLAYGISRKERVIIVTYSLSVVIYGAVVVAILIYR